VPTSRFGVRYKGPFADGRVEPMIRTKRIYEEATPDDGARILVDRLWPRGVSHEDAALDAWAKSVAPSDELREWFDHDPERWAEFERRYHAELAEKRTVLEEELLDVAGERDVTLLYATTDTEHNNAVALRSYLLDER